MKWIFAVLLCICCTINLKAQITGQVFDQSKRTAIGKVEVFNMTNNSLAYTNAKGNFSIKGKVNDILVFMMPGYQSDTVLLINLQPLRRYLEIETNTLAAVSVNRKSLRDQYAQTFNKANAVLLTPGRGLLFYPSAYFSKEGKRARKLKRMIKQEEIDLQIDKRFNVKMITAILPLKQQELDAFMVRYRPSLKFVQRADDADFKFYLMDAYDKFKRLPASKKVLPALKID